MKHEWLEVLTMIGIGLVLFFIAIVFPLLKWAEKRMKRPGGFFNGKTDL